jgi:hypothetical protein
MEQDVEWAINSPELGFTQAIYRVEPNISRREAEIMALASA